MEDNKYIKDVNSGAVLETNIVALKQHRMRRTILKQKETKISELENRIEKLESILTELLKDKI